MEARELLPFNQMCQLLQLIWVERQKCTPAVKNFENRLRHQRGKLFCIYKFEIATVKNFGKFHTMRVEK